MSSLKDLVRKSHYFFLDETGNHGLTFVDKNFPYFLLCGCLFSESEKQKLDQAFDSIKQEFFKNKKVIFHSRDIRKCEKFFKVLFDLEVKKTFYEKLNQTIDDLDFKIIAAGIQKENHIRKYGKQANDPYAISLSFVLERLISYLDDLDAQSEVEIIAESRGKKEDQLLLSHFNKVFDIGTYWVDASRFKKRIKSFSFREKIQNDNGLQLADLCAYPLVRNLIYPEDLYIPYKIIQEKIYTKNGKIYGLKVFP